MLLTMEQQYTTSKRVLFVDSDEAFGATLKTVLGPGYRLLNAGSVEEATQFLHSGGIDVVLLNWDQPSRTDHSGCLELLKESQELEVSPPVLGFSWDG